MIAFVTTIGEPTTDLCIWSLRRNGFEVHTVSGKTTLAQKLKGIYSEALSLDQDFIRIDADVIVNHNVKEEHIRNSAENHKWWIQYNTFGWFSQDLIWGGVQYIKREALPALVANIDSFMGVDRPETRISRIPEFHQPRRFESFPMVCGVHGYGIRDYKDVMKQKALRGQSANYDFEMVERLNAL